MEIYGEKDFQTPWSFIHRGVLPPKSGIGHHQHVQFEECYVILDGAARFTWNGKTVELTGGAMVPCTAGDSHGIYNHTDSDVQWMNLGVAPTGGGYDAVNFGQSLENEPLVSPEEVPHVVIDRSAMQSASHVHQGKGEMFFRSLFGHDIFKTNWGFIHHCLLPPDTSIGYHRHDTIEECYMILSGRGRMKVDGEVFEVSAGDFIPNQLGGCHGIYNHTDDPLELLNMAVCVGKGKFDATDLGDDLRGCGMRDEG
jgi:mannose-6-phosphate isomerase-like protein (cupin superfamily)